MSYQRALLTRWSKRDRLAVVVIAVTAAFLVGAVIVLLAVAGQTTAIASEFGAETSVELTTERDVDSDSAVFPLSTVQIEGQEYTMVGIPESNTYGLAAPDGVAGPVSGTSVTLEGKSTVKRPVVQRNGETPFPNEWLVTDAATAREIGADRGLVFRESTSPVPESGAPMVGALAFFLSGTRQILGLLTVVCAGAAVLIGVIVFSVTRMTVRERAETLRVLRATGATPQRVLLLVAARAGVLTLAGVAVGYALGVIIPNAAANIAITLGLPIGLPMTMSGRTALIVAGMLGGLVCVGLVAGSVAALGAVRGAPLDQQPTGARRWPGGPSFLPSGAVVPTTATLAVFIAFVLVVVSLSGVVGNVGGTTGQAGGTIVAPTAAHPVESQVDMAYAEALQRSGTAASPEILLFQVHNGSPFPARGVDFEAYQSVTDAELVAGRGPNASDEAVIGADLAATLELGPGDEIALGGSTAEAVTTVEIVGTFSASGAADDHLLVTLPTARHLSTVGPGNVNIIRLAERPTGSSEGGIVVLDIDTPSQVVRGESVEVEVRIRNVGSDSVETRLPVRFGSKESAERVTVAPEQQQTLTYRFNASRIGQQTVAVENSTERVLVVEPTALQTPRLPDLAPTNATLRVPIQTMAGENVENATLTIGSYSTSTGSNGIARVQLPTEPGSYSVTIEAGERSIAREIELREDVQRTPILRLTVPNETGVFTQPTARLTASNPWDTPLQVNATLSGPGAETAERIQLAAGQSDTVTATLDRRPPGPYAVQATVGERTLERQYRVTGDERLANAIASSGRVSGGVGTSGLLSRAFGNIGLVLATLLALGVVMTVGSTVAAFSDAVQARRGDLGIHRAVGASPLQVGRLVLADAVRIAIPAGVGGVSLAVAALAGLSWAGALTVFGVQLTPQAPVGLLVAITAGALTIALVSSLLVVARYASGDPARLFGGGQ